MSDKKQAELQNQGDVNWHTLNADTVLNLLGSSRSGLSNEESARRLEKYGPNELKEEEKVSPLKIIVEQFKQFLIIILLVATTISLFLGELTDAVVIFAIVIASAVLGFVQEYRASKAVEALKKLVTTTVTVIREGSENRIPSSQVVPGDLIQLTAGDKITSDARIISENNLKTNEAALTGESELVEKEDTPLPVETGIYARRNMVFAGTVVAYGRAKAVATTTGMRSEFGKIAALIETVEIEKTPLEKKMQHLGRTLGIISFAIVGVVFTIGILRGNEFLDMLLWSISLAVAAVPEALPAVVTGALALGMTAMAKQKAIVKRLPAVETLGSTSVICSDKTGTLTKGEMTVTEIYLNWTRINVTGVGYTPTGEFIGKAPDKEGEFMKSIALCNDSKVFQSYGSWKVEGDPTEGALTVLALKRGVSLEQLNTHNPRINEIVFSSERKRMTTIHRTTDGHILAYMKGAPEIILERCNRIIIEDKIVEITEKMRKDIHLENESMAKRALRVLGLAYTEITLVSNNYDDRIEHNMIFIGLVGMIDPPREEAKQAVKLCSEAGIKTVMITGDNKYTAMAVASELGMLREGAMTGEELDSMSDDDFEKIVDKVSVYARISPGGKMRIVKAFKKKGHIVAATGDGVNDAPALRAADIGVSMGITGTEATKEASDMILMDDNFATLVSAVEKGRVIFTNIKKFLTFLLSSNIGELFIMLTAGLLGAPLPLLTIQILWINLVTDGLPAIA
ncbi:MAG TPA: HAD-IC family P-type ATPase, partial [Nitrososphaerales archaeon]